MSCAHENLDDHDEGLQCRDCGVLGEFVEKDTLRWMMRARHLKPGEHVVTRARSPWGSAIRPGVIVEGEIVRSYESET